MVSKKQKSIDTTDTGNTVVSKTPEEQFKEFLSGIGQILKDHDEALKVMMDRIQQLEARPISRVEVMNPNSVDNLYGNNPQNRSMAKPNNTISTITDLVKGFLTALPELTKEDSPEKAIYKENTDLVKSLINTQINNAIALSNTQVDMAKIALDKARKEVELLGKGSGWSVD